MKTVKWFILFISFCFLIKVNAQPPHGLHWSEDGNSYYDNNEEGIVKYQMPSFAKTVVATTQQLTPKDFFTCIKSAQLFFLW